VLGVSHEEVGEACGMLGMSMDQLGGSQMKLPQWLWTDILMKSELVVGRTMKQSIASQSTFFFGLSCLNLRNVEKQAPLQYLILGEKNNIESLELRE